MRRKEDRTSQILELLVKEKKMEVAGLSAHLGVSQVTVRKDLDAMEAQGLIKREHGFAVLSSTDDIKGRLAYHYEEKRRIALRAAELVRDGDTIMIESGSCCALLAAALTESRSGVTIITNSAFIADYIRRSSDFQIILLGGIYQQAAFTSRTPRSWSVPWYVSARRISGSTASSSAWTAGPPEPVSPIRTRCAPRPSAIWPVRRTGSSS